MSGKGSGRRPGEGYEDAHARIFGEKKRERYVPPPIDSAQQQAQDQGSLNHIKEPMQEGIGGT